MAAKLATHYPTTRGLSKLSKAMAALCGAACLLFVYKSVSAQEIRLVESAIWCVVAAFSLLLSSELLSIFADLGDNSYRQVEVCEQQASLFNQLLLKRKSQESSANLSKMSH